jgi:hypothetical protein
MYRVPRCYLKLTGGDGLKTQGVFGPHPPRQQRGRCPWLKRDFYSKNLGTRR